MAKANAPSTNISQAVKKAQALLAEHATPLQRQLYATPIDPDWAPISPEAKFRGLTGHALARIMPEPLQAGHHRCFNRGVMVIDDVIPKAEFDELGEITQAMAYITKGCSRPSTVCCENNKYFTKPISDQFSSVDLGHELTTQLNAVLDRTITNMLNFLLPLTQPPEAIVHCNAWINTGPIGSSTTSGQSNYHFCHYDSDEYLEFFHPEPMVRFPVWGAILYIHQPADLLHYTCFEAEGLNQNIRAQPNRLVIFDPSLVHGVFGPPTLEEINLRSILVINAWDYPALDHGTLVNHDTI
jgi:hypothetical protein